MKNYICLLVVTSLFCYSSNAQWISQNPTNISPTSRLAAVYFTSPTTGYIAGGGGLNKTIDGGVTWSNNLIPATSFFQSVFFVGPDTGYVAGSPPYKTTDGGNTWSALPVIPGLFPPVDGLQFINGHTGFIYEPHGPLFKTTDGGNSWSLIKNGLGLGSIFGHYFLNSDTGFVVSAGSFDGVGIEKTTNGGTTWSAIAHPDSADYFDVHFPNDDDGWVVGSGGSILNTNDGGNTWTKQISGTTERLQSVHFLNNQEGVAVGLNGTIVKTKDGGANWYSQISNTSDHLHDVHFYNDSMGCIVGNNRTIRTTTTVGEWPTGNKIVEKIKFKVYPNPTAHSISLESEQKIKYITILSMTGTIILRQKANAQKVMINTEHYAAGNYTIMVNFESGSYSQDFSVKKN